RRVPAGDLVGRGGGGLNGRGSPADDAAAAVPGTPAPGRGRGGDGERRDRGARRPLARAPRPARRGGAGDPPAHQRLRRQGARAARHAAPRDVANGRDRGDQRRLSSFTLRYIVSRIAGTPTRTETKGVPLSTLDIWTYREQTWTTSDITGYGVEAIDGSIGKVDEASYDVGAGYMVVDTGPWIFGKKVMLPAGMITRVDRDDEKVFVNRTKDQIKNAPEFDESRYRDEPYRTELGSYYGPGGAGYLD